MNLLCGVAVDAVFHGQDLFDLVAADLFDLGAAVDVAHVDAALLVAADAPEAAPLEHASLHQPLQPFGQDLAGDAQGVLIAEVNLYDIAIETAYDETSKEKLCTHWNLTPCPAEIEGTYFTRLVDSDQLSGDIKRVNVYFYRRQSDATPYRAYKQEISLPEINYSLQWSGATGSLPVYKDSTGKVWTRMSTWPPYEETDGSFQAGFEPALTTGAGPNAIYGPTAGFGGIDTSTVQDAFPWNYFFESQNTAPYYLGFKFPATQGVSYKISMGFSEQQDKWPGDRIEDVYINGTLVDTIDASAEAGVRKPLVKTYTAEPFVDGFGNAVITVQLRPNASATFNLCDINWISIERMN